MSEPTLSSPVLATYGHDATTTQVNGMRVASDGPAIEPEGDYLVDISAVRKVIALGPGATAYLSDNFGKAPENLFDCVTTSKNQTLVHLHYDRYLIINALEQGETAINERAHETAIDGGVLLRYDVCECALIGPHQQTILHELSATSADLLSPELWLATRIAHADVGIRLIQAPQPHLRIICSTGDARFMFSTLAEVVNEVGGSLSTFDAYSRYVAST